MFAYTSPLRREASIKAQFEDVNMTWTMSMAFYALSGGCIYTSRTGEQRVLRRDAIAYLAAHDPQSLFQLQRVVVQNPGKANAFGKAITCVQALWFCSQCIARLSGSLAVSLLELNTFAHCISTLLIYIFWWDKLYDVEVHTFVVSKSLDLFLLLEHFTGIYTVPVLCVQHGSDENNQDLVAYVSDPNGNRLIRAKTRLNSYSQSSLAPILDETAYARIDWGSKIRVCDTGLYTSFESSHSITAPIYTRMHNDKDWRRLWFAWVENGRPVPPEPITQTERWFYRRTAGSPDLDANLADQITSQVRPLMCIMMNFTFMAHGGLHLLAWQYNFKTRSERYLWRISAVTTASTGLVLLVLYIASTIREETNTWHLFFGHSTSRKSYVKMRFYHWVAVGLRSLLWLLVAFNIASRAFLVIESFIALPNSPRSTYTIPSWTAYIPHI